MDGRALFCRVGALMRITLRNFSFPSSLHAFTLPAISDDSSEPPGRTGVIPPRNHRTPRAGRGARSAGRGEEQAEGGAALRSLRTDKLLEAHLVVCERVPRRVVRALEDDENVRVLLEQLVHAAPEHHGHAVLLRAVELAGAGRGGGASGRG